MVRQRVFGWVAGIVVTVASAMVIGAVLLTSGPAATPPERASPTPTPGVTGDPALDALIDSLLRDDAPKVRARFGGVMARAGGLLGGPIGLFQPQQVGTSDWTAQLASSVRTVHAVVKDPTEPFEWWDQPTPPFPRAAIFSGQRDFDVVLIVRSMEGTPRAWRFSIDDGVVVDIVIDNGNDPGGGGRPLVRALGYLTPSPDREPGKFLVLPPHEMRPPPAGIGLGDGQAPPAPVRSPSMAPDGRTGDAAVDAHIDRLLKSDAAALATAYGDLAGSEERCAPDCDRIRVSPSTWTSRLAGASRSLYAVFTGDSADATVVLAVQSGSAPEEAWRFGTVAGQLRQVDILMPLPGPSGVRVPILRRGVGIPLPDREYERFYVLPPAGDLPQAPRLHPLSVRVGAAGADALLMLLEARDGNALVSAFADPTAVPVRECGGPGTTMNASSTADWARTASAQIRGLHSVATLPVGYVPRADHLVIVYRQLKPYWWVAVGILERGGKIVGLITSEWGCSPEVIYPPAGYVVAPPPNGVAGLDPSRRSGIAVIDAILDAAAARDEAAMDRSIAYTKVACGDPSGMPPGAGPPACPSGAAPGTLVEILPEIVCHGGHTIRERAPKEVIEWITRGAPYGLYAVVGSPPARVVVIGSKGEIGGAVALTVGERGISSLRAGCGPWHPDALIGGGQPSFLLPPP